MKNFTNECIPLPPEWMNEDEVTIYHNQTAILIWLQSKGHKVLFEHETT